MTGIRTPMGDSTLIPIFFKSRHFLRLSRSSRLQMFQNIGVIKYLPNFTEKTCTRVFFSVSLQIGSPNFIKKYCRCSLYYEFCKIFKSTFFIEHLQSTASDFCTIRGYKHNPSLFSENSNLTSSFLYQFMRCKILQESRLSFALSKLDKRCTRFYNPL